MSNGKVTMVCCKCGSEDVMLDAWAEWDFANQEWTLRSTHDNAFCNDCGGETRIEEKELTDERT